MQIVIDTPDEKYDRLIKQMQLDRNFSACKISLLPKGHGGLIDEKELVKYIIRDNCEDGCGYIDERDLIDIPKIIEADKED